MCDHCGTFDADRLIEVTEDNVQQMLHESTTVALHAASSYSNGWIKGAKGLTEDMFDKWGQGAAVRMVYVWGAARYFLPAGPDGPDFAPGYSDMEARLRDVIGEAPDAGQVGHLLSVNDRAVTLASSIGEAASRGDVEQVGKLLSDAEDPETRNALLALLIADAGFRMRHCRDTENERAHELFNAHVSADLADDEEEGEQGSGDG